MNNVHQSPVTLEPIDHHHHKLLCWKSVLAGALVSILAFLILSALGAGIGGLTAAQVIDKNGTGTGLATGTALWLGISAAVSVFVGSYFASRISGFVSHKGGIAHGVVVASLFFVIMAFGAGKAAHGVSRSFARMMSDVGASSELAADPFVQDSIQKSLGSATLKSTPKEVEAGLIARLGAGDDNSAVSYYSYQTGVTRAEAEKKVAELKAEFEQKAKLVAERTSVLIADAGWCLFVTFTLGLIAAIIGGCTAACQNHHKPLAVCRKEVIPNVKV